MPIPGMSEEENEVFANKNFRQIVAILGDGNLKDDSDCSRELREYLSSVEAEKLYEHADFCLTSTFESSGYALQDLVNELGRRLGFTVTDGRYRGVVNDVGHDGLWQSNQQDLIVEVKTTDAYRLNLQTLANYRSDLLLAEAVSPDASILIVVGRNDTGELEEQIRGSRFAWDIRIISVAALCDLVTLNIRSDEIATADKIRAVLKPIEYTRVDGLIDVMLTAVNDVDVGDEAGTGEVLQREIDETAEEGNLHIQNQTPHEVQAEVRSRAVANLSKKLGKTFVQARRTDFLSTDKTTLAVCLFSKVYGEKQKGGLWFGINPNQFEKLADYANGYFLFCSEAKHSVVIPLDKIKKLSSKMNVTDNENHFHWHVQIEFENERYELVLRNGEKIDISKYCLP